MWKFRKVGHTPFLELQAEQRSQPWFDARLFRITASNYDKAIDGDLSRFKTQEECLLEIRGKGEKLEPNEAMLLGVIQEDPHRNWYAEYSKSKITEPSLCVGLSWYDFPMWWDSNKLMSSKYPSQLLDPMHPNWFIGGSPDGEIYYQDGKEANMEIKFTKKFYKPLEKHLNICKSGLYVPQARYYKHDSYYLSQHYSEDRKKYYPIFSTGIVDYSPHIWTSHFMQMQGCMAILGRDQCIYLVGSPEKKYVEEVKYDERFWRYFLYPHLVKTIETKLKPAMTDEEKKQITERHKKMIALVPKGGEVMYKY